MHLRSWLRAALTAHMKRKLKYFLLQLRLKNGEHEQGIVRLIFVSLIRAYLLYCGLTALPLLVIDIVIVYSILILASLFYFPGKNTRLAQGRRWLSMFADLSSITVGLLITHEAGAVLFWIYLWVILGNGMRYGARFLFVGQLFSVVGFLLVFALSDFWRAHEVISFGLLLTLTMVPFYTLKLLKSLQLATENARQSNAAKNYFIAQLSHDIRSPLNGIANASGLLKTTKLNPEQRDLVGILSNTTSGLKHIIENVLSMTRAENEMIEPNKVNFNLFDLVRNTTEMFRIQADEKQIDLFLRVDADTPIKLYGDAPHLQQILINLIGNAIKFTPKGRVEIRVHCSSSNEVMGTIRCEVFDTGIGISTIDQKRIFRRFSHANPAIIWQFGGSGFGISICNDLVQMMGGQMGVDSSLGKGSTFWIEVPFEIQSPDSIAHQERTHVICVGLPGNDLLFVKEHLGNWGMFFEQEDSVPRLFSRLIDLQAFGGGKIVLLCNHQHIGIAPKEFIRHISEITSRRSVSMVLVNPDRQYSAQQLGAFGYADVLNSPIERTRLFNALHVGPTPYPSGVISFNAYFEKQHNPARGLRVLVADDNNTSRRITAKILEVGGHEVVLADSGEHALSILEDSLFDILILDLKMPVFDGIEVMKIHRSSDIRIKTPVIILTANGSFEARHECNESGVDAFLTKPVVPSVLLETISRLTRTPALSSTHTLAAYSASDSDVDLIHEETLEQLEILGVGQEGFMYEVVQGFIAETEAALSKIRDSVLQNEQASFKTAIYSIKGGASNIGAIKLTNLCTVAANMEFENAADLLGEIHSCFTSTRVALLKSYVNR